MFKFGPWFSVIWLNTLLPSLSLTLGVWQGTPGGYKSEVVTPLPALLLTLLCSQYRWAGGLKGSQGLLDPSHSQALSEALSTLHLLELRRRDRPALG